MLKQTGHDLQIAIGKGTPNKNDVVYGAIFIDEDGRRIITKGKSGSLKTIANYTSDKSIHPPIFTVEQENSKAVNLADVTLSALPNAVNCTIDTVEMKIVKVSDGTVIDTQSTTNLTLPIVFESQNLEANTEYRWEVRCRDTNLNIDALNSVTLATSQVFDILLNSVATFSDFWNVSNPATITYTRGKGFDKNSNNIVTWKSDKIKRLKFLEFDLNITRENYNYALLIVMYVNYSDGSKLRVIYCSSRNNYLSGRVESNSISIGIPNTSTFIQSFSLDIADKDIDSITLQGFYTNTHKRSYINNIKFKGVQLW